MFNNTPQKQTSMTLEKERKAEGTAPAKNTKAFFARFGRDTIFNSPDPTALVGALSSITRSQAKETTKSSISLSK